MRLGLSHLRGQLFNYKLIDTPFCENETCDHVAETPSHYLSNCPRYADIRHTMLSSISEIVFPGVNQNTIVNLMPEYLCGVLMKGSETLSLEKIKTIIFKHVFRFIDELGRFTRLVYIYRKIILRCCPLELRTEALFGHLGDNKSPA